jgi:hypothetical protein
MSQQARYARDDALTARMAPVPEFMPPLDGDPGLADTQRTAGGMLARPSSGAMTPQGGWPYPVPDRPSLGPGTPGPGIPGPGPAGLGGAEPRDWPQQFARMLTEALAGLRPARQVQPWTSSRARRQLQRILPGFGGGQRPRVVRIVTTRPARDVIEMSVIAGFGPRLRALALRLERVPGAEHGAGWICTDIEAA